MLVHFGTIKSKRFSKDISAGHKKADLKLSWQYILSLCFTCLLQAIFTHSNVLNNSIRMQKVFARGVNYWYILYAYCYIVRCIVFYRVKKSPHGCLRKKASYLIWKLIFLKKSTTKLNDETPVQMILLHSV